MQRTPIHPPPQARFLSPKPPASPAPTMTDPDPFVLMGTDTKYDIIVARALTITATPACLTAGTPPTRAGHAPTVGWRRNQPRLRPRRLSCCRCPRRWLGPLWLERRPISIAVTAGAESGRVCWVGPSTDSEIHHRD